jgi:hypothetical protein
VLAERQVSTRSSNRQQMRRAAAAGGERSGVEYLVSWKELPLDQATWEAEEVRGTMAAAVTQSGFCCWLVLCCKCRLRRLAVSSYSASRDVTD